MLFYIALYAHMKLFLSAKYLEVKMLDTGYVIFKKIYLLCQVVLYKTLSLL